MKIAVIGSGISGLTCAYYLSAEHDVHVFENESRIGGHTATKDVHLDGRDYKIDTGFIVFNNWTYPNFIRLLAELNVPWRDSEMSFSVNCERTGLQYAGSSIDTLFAQRKNILSISYLRMLKDIYRFNHEAVEDLEAGKLKAGTTLGEYLKENGYSKQFHEHYLIPMGAAIWSSSVDDMFDFPLEFFVRFFKNHGLLNIKNRPKWKTIVNGSQAYLKPISKPFEHNIRLNTKVEYIKREDDCVKIKIENQEEEIFDHVILATHSDQALSLLANPSDAERSILSAIPYKMNDVVLHTDSSLLPSNAKVRASWNYTISKEDADAATLTYDMNTLQGIDSTHDFLVTLNQPDKINQSKVLGHYQYSHPQFTLGTIAAQNRWVEINHHRTWFCGAYWRNGFHEDGVFSALRVVNAIQGEKVATKILTGHALPEHLQRSAS